MLLIESPGARIEQNSISADGLTTDQAGLIVFDSSDVRIDGTLSATTATSACSSSG